MHLNMCEWGVNAPWKWGGQIAQSWRMSKDHVGIWASTKAQVRSTALIPDDYTGRPWAWNDMDMLQTGNYEQAAHANGKESNMTAAEYRTEFSMWAIAASPLVVTTPIMNCSSSPGPVVCKGWLSELQRQILLNEEVLAINQDVTPQGRPIVDGALDVWARSLSDGSWAVALYNEDDAPKAAALDLTKLGLRRAKLRDLWERADVGTFEGRYPATGTLTLAPHQTVLLRVTPAASADP